MRQTLCPILDSPDSDQIMNIMYQGLLTELDGLAFDLEKDLQPDAVSNAAFSVQWLLGAAQKNEYFEVFNFFFFQKEVSF